MAGRNVEVDLAAVYRLLLSGALLTEVTAEKVIERIDSILRSEDAEIEWDDAWDTIDLLGCQHQKALPFLCAMAMERGACTLDDRYARVWATRAISRIGGDISQAVPALVEALHGEIRELRHEAAKTLRKCGYKHLIKRRWHELF